MKMLLNKWGLDQVPYLADLIDAGWRVLLVLVLAWILWRICAHLIGLARLRLLVRATGPDDTKRVHTMTRVFRYAVGVVVIIVTVMLVLGELGISVAPLIATAGVAGIALGFGVQSLVKDYFTGFALLVENQVRQGDEIEAAGKTGLVEEVTLRYIRLRDYEGIVHFIPNGLVSTVSNKSMGFGYAVIQVGVGYGCDLEEAMRIMRAEAAALRADPVLGPRIVDDLELDGIESFAASAVTLRGRMKTLPQEQQHVRRALQLRLKRAFDAARIDMPYPQVVVHAAPARTPFKVEVLEARPA
jgi:moderate conductance mechanosensitive channel